MNEKPILFSGEMVRAIQSGRKTQTRRTVKKQPRTGDINPTKDEGIWSAQTDRSVVSYFACPYGQPGDRLWVKETHLPKASGIIYRADFDKVEAAGVGAMYGGWKPSIFCRREYSRITLEIESVRAERLQVITDADAKREGCCGVASTQFGVPNFRYVWETINGHKSWKANPWVWVVTFKQVFNGEVRDPAT